MFLDKAFTQNVLENNLQGRKILHIATHAKFEPTAPKNSFFLLGNGDPYSIFQVQSLRHLRNIHLVVLSACETARGGEDHNGIEVAGISSYFLRDKAKAVIASLWQVNDASTSALMQHFYDQIAKGTKTKAEALQWVQNAMIRQDAAVIEAYNRSFSIVPRDSKANPNTRLSHPYYWAPFILIGNGL